MRQCSEEREKEEREKVLQAREEGPETEEEKLKIEQVKSWHNQQILPKLQTQNLSGSSYVK
jgi:hypothetical protein